MLNHVHNESRSEDVHSELSDIRDDLHTYESRLHSLQSDISDHYSAIIQEKLRNSDPDH